MKKLITLAALLCAMCVMFSCNDGSSQPPVFKAGDDFAQAISELKSGETLFVSDDVDLEAPLTIPAGKDIVIQLLGDSEIEYEGSGSAFVVEEGAKLTIKGPASGSGKSKKNGAAEGAVIESDGPVDSLFTIGYGAEEPRYGSAVAASRTGKIEIEGGSYTSEIYCLVTYPQASSTAKATITCTGAALDHNAYPCPAAGVFLYEVFHLIDIGTVPVLSLMPNKSRKIWLKKIQKN